jgi:acyl-CoA dehydrogenase
LDSARVDVLAQELARVGARPPLAELNTGIKMLAPILLSHGTAEQQQRFLPLIARGSVRWCQGYSEPEAGSDLASLRTRAVLDDDSYVVTGHKIWSSYAHMSDWIFCLVRTSNDDKHRGISFLLIDLESPGITVEPITLLSGSSIFCEVHFSDVRVPRDQLVGEPGAGWPVAKELLRHERAMLGSAGSSGLSGGSGGRSTSMAVLVAKAMEQQEAAARGALAERFGQHLAEVAGLKATATRLRQENRRDAVGPSLIKLVSTELNMKREDFIVELLGLDGLSWDGDAAVQNVGRAREWLRSRANSIEGGTSEIQLNIIARHGLELPQGTAS